MRFHEIIAEGRDASLYHWMEGAKIINTLAGDRLEARVNHPIPGMGNVLGVSLSRNKKFTFGDRGEVRLTVNQTRLAQKFKIVPLDGEAAFRRKAELEPTVADRDNAHRPEWMFAEEFVIGAGIDELHRYVSAIFIQRRSTRVPVEAYQACAEYAAKWNIPISTEPASLPADVALFLKQSAAWEQMNPWAKRR